MQENRRRREWLTRLPKRPVGDVPDPKSEPDQHGLKCQSRTMIPPTQRFSVKRDAVKRMVEVGWPYAQGIKRKADCGPFARLWDQ